MSDLFVLNCFLFLDVISSTLMKNKLDLQQFPLILAPMAGVSDVGFRALASFFGADATTTEMLSARAMAHNPRKTEFMTLTTDAEKIKIAQIFGHEADVMKNAVISPMLEKFDGIDINMGCPAPKIIKNGEGAALMDNLSLASKIISTCKNATLTIKRFVEQTLKTAMDENIEVIEI